MYVPGGTGLTVSMSTLTNIAVATYPRVYVRPMENHELELVTSTCTMSCNALLQDCTRHIYYNKHSKYDWSSILLAFTVMSPFSSTSERAHHAPRPKSSGILQGILVTYGVIWCDVPLG
jgi:hypothetical protein